MTSAKFQLFFGGCGVDESPQGLRTQAGGTAERRRDSTTKIINEIWGFPYMVSQNEWFIMESPTKIYDFMGYPY